MDRRALFGIAAFGAIVGSWLAFWPPRHRHRWEFERNEPCKLAECKGQWWWEYSRCACGALRRELVAGPRG